MVQETAGTWVPDEFGMPVFYSDDYVRAAYARKMRQIKWRYWGDFILWVLGRN